MGTVKPAVAPPHRRALLAALLCAPTSALAASAPGGGAAPVVTVLGDSITAGLGLAAAEALPAQLEAALARRGVRAVVRAAGVSGDTTAGGLARLDFSVQPDTAVCVVELGGNDVLQSLEAADTERNLRAIVARLRRRRIGVVLAGGRLPQRSTGAYGREFAAGLSAVGRSPGVVYAPDALDPVREDSALRQGDGIHPNARGVRVLAERLAPAVAGALRSRRAG